MASDKNKTSKVQPSQKKENESVEKLLEMEKKAAELEDKLKRSLADYSNLERRIESQRQLFVTLATTAIITKMIDILDDLYLAQNHLKDQGLQMAIDKFLSVLKSEGLEEIKTENAEFNPEFMEAVDVADGQNDKVVSTRKKGYLLNGHPIRPAQVVVGREVNSASN